MKKQLEAKRMFINPVFKDKATILKTSEETGGEYSLGELEVAPGVEITCISTRLSKNVYRC